VRPSTAADGRVRRVAALDLRTTEERGKTIADRVGKLAEKVLKQDKEAPAEEQDQEATGT
jgi:hypothetical protein